MNAQDAAAAVYANVEARGYTAGYTTDQLIARNITKSLEELGEAAKHVMIDPTGDADDAIDSLRLIARSRFKSRDWSGCGVIDPHELLAEIDDVAVTLLMLARLYQERYGVEVDILARAVAKSSADVARGVR